MSAAIRATCLLLGALALGAAQRASAKDPGVGDDPRKIMQQVFERAAGERRSTRMKMTISDGSGSRERSMVMKSTRNGGVRKSVVLIDAPAESRGTGFLSIDYDAVSKDDERYLYLPSLRRTTRIANSQLSSSFLGSDFSYADLSPPNPALFDFKLSKEEEVDGERCWLIVAKAKTRDARESVGYNKSEFWVSKDKLAIVRFRAAMTDGRKIKYLQASDFQKAPDGWVAKRMEARTVRGGKLLSQTVLRVVSIKANDSSITEADFTKQRLERGI